MTHAKMIAPMGAMMGVMAPLMLHSSMAAVGLGFLLGHLAAGLAVACLLLLVPRARARLAAHRPTRAQVGRMAVWALAGGALVCTHCLATLHGSV